MEALGQVWRVLVIIFQGVKSLWSKYWTYRAQKAQQRQLEKTSVSPSPPIDKNRSAELGSESQTPEPAHEQSVALAPSRPDKQQIELALPKEERESASFQQGQWYAPGHSVQIQEFFIADGFLYVGQILNPESPAQRSAPYLINPDLKVQTVARDQRQVVLEMDWDRDGTLSYSTLSPEMRGVFLGWLATGRKEREIPISALLLFLYGIESRVIELLDGERTLDELLAIILELERLEVHYAHHQTVVPKLQGLIECCQVQLALSCQPETLLALLPVGQKLSMALKVALGRCIEDAKPIPMSLLWAWYQSSAIAVDLKTPAKRCDSAFNFLIQTRGEQQGFSIISGDNPVTLPVVYQPFSPVFEGDATAISVIDTVDIAGFEPQLTFLESLIEDCTNDLDAYSRLVGRSPEAEGTLPAVALLPQELVLISGNDTVKAFQQWLNEKLEISDSVMIPGTDLLAQWPTADPDKIRKKEAELLGQLMAKLGFGYAPDVRYGHASFNPKHSVILFRLTVPGVESISAEYPSALALWELKPFMDAVPQGELETEIIESFTTDFDLTPSERSRLSAFDQWRLERPLTWKQVLSRVKKLLPDQQEKLAIALDAELQANWRLEEARYIELQSLIPLPHLEIVDPTSPSTVVNDDVEMAVSDDVETDNESELTTTEDIHAETNLETVSKTVEDDTSAIDAEPLTEDITPPEEVEPEPPAFVLDTQLIALRSQESQIASGLLSDIFTEEDTQASLPTPEIEDAPAPVEEPEATLALGLDEFHWHLLDHLGQKESWDRAELEAIAQGQGLLLDGALENINDVAFDHCDEALTEGDDPIEVNDWVFDELKAA